MNDIDSGNELNRLQQFKVFVFIDLCFGKKKPTKYYCQYSLWHYGSIVNIPNARVSYFTVVSWQIHRIGVTYQQFNCQMVFFAICQM